jgi:YesN/AraC family two-component response regulator
VQNLYSVLEPPVNKYNHYDLGAAFYNLNYLSRSDQQQGLKMMQQNMFVFKGAAHKEREHEKPGTAKSAWKGATVPFDDVNGHLAYKYTFLFELEERLCGTLLRSTAKKLQATMDYIAMSLESVPPYDTTTALRVYLHLFHAIIRTLYKGGFALSDIIGSDADPCARMEQFATKQEIHNYIVGICLQICKHTADLRADKNQRIVWEVKSYIEEHFNKDFGLEHLSERVKCSSTYINRLLKQYTGSTFYNLLTEKRIVRSKQLLSLQDWTVGQISSEVGYNNVHSFIRAFKRSEGVTPGQYRDLVIVNALEI